jgi:hypothetical protein
VLNEFALVGFAGNDGLAFERDVALVEAKFGFPIVFIVTVTDVAVLGKNRTDIAIELNFVCRGRDMRNSHQQQRQGR